MTAVVDCKDNCWSCYGYQFRAIHRHHRLMLVAFTESEMQDAYDTSLYPYIDWDQAKADRRSRRIFERGGILHDRLRVQRVAYQMKAVTCLIYGCIYTSAKADACCLRCGVERPPQHPLMGRSPL